MPPAEQLQFCCSNEVCAEAILREKKRSMMIAKLTYEASSRCRRPTEDLAYGGRLQRFRTSGFAAEPRGLCACGNVRGACGKKAEGIDFDA